MSSAMLTTLCNLGLLFSLLCAGAAEVTTASYNYDLRLRFKRRYTSRSSVRPA